ncbi:MAG: sortase [Clostridia bacterium]|nr:sortase [Clostridia bacterium]
MSNENENFDVAEALKNALPPKKPADDADEILGEILGKSGSYNESFHSMMNKYLGAGGGLADDADVDTGRIFRRHVDEDLESHISADGGPVDRETEARIRRKLAPSVRDIYVSEETPPEARPTFTPDGSVVYPEASVADGERVVFDADWEQQAKEEAGRIDEMRRSGVTSGGRNLGDTFRFVGQDPQAEKNAPGASARARAGRTPVSVGHEDFLTPVIGKARDEEEMKKEVRTVKPVAGEEDEGLTGAEKALVDDAVLQMFTAADEKNAAFREKWAETVSKAQRRREMLEEENKKENARLRSEEKLREKEKQVADNDYRWTSSGRERPASAQKAAPELRFEPRRKSGLPDENELVEHIAVDDTPQEMIYKKGKGEKLAFSLKARFSKEGFRRYLRGVFPVRDDPGSEKARKVFRILMFIIMVAALVVFVLTFTPWFRMYRTNKTVTDEIASLENLTPEEQAELWVAIKAQYPDVEFPEGMNVKFAYRYAINQDVVGRVAIEGLGLDTVLVQASDDNFYLYRDMYKQKSRYGTPYVKADSRMGKDGFSKNIIIYGHNTHDGLIFNILERYTKAQTMRDYPIITLDTLYETTKWKIFAVMLTNANPADDNGKSFDYLYSDFYSGSHFLYVVNGMKERSLIHTGVDVNEYDNILTLYTCYRYQFDSGRLVIVARQLREGESEEINKNAVWYDDSAYLPAAYYGETETSTEETTGDDLTEPDAETPTDETENGEPAGEPDEGPGNEDEGPDEGNDEPDEGNGEENEGGGEEPGGDTPDEPADDEDED